MDLYKLDNPVWYALVETHQRFGIDYDQTRFYQPDYCPFGGFQENANVSKAIDDYSTLTDSFFVVGERPVFNATIQLINRLVCEQMLLTNGTPISISENIIELKSDQQLANLHQLVNLVQPGYFRIKTPEMGRYYGIYKEGVLVAVTGERMQMDNFTEVSAVVTHPNHTRKGYAKQLVTHTTKEIIKLGKTPYLHVAASNLGAIALYQKLGFELRRQIDFWQFKKKQMGMYKTE